MEFIELIRSIQNSFEFFKSDENWAQLFVYLFNLYIVSLFREDMRKIIYNDFSHHLYTMKTQKNDDRSQNFKSSKTISLIKCSL